MSDVVSPADSQSNDPPEQHAAPRSRKMLRGLGLLLIAVSVLLGWYLLVVYLGWQSGQSTLVNEQAAEEAALLARQVTLAQENIEQGSYNLALRRLEYVLERDPTNQQAIELQAQAQSRLDAFNTPQTAVTNTPTPRPLPTATRGIVNDPQLELQRIRRLAASGSWEEAVSALVAFQRQFPAFERQETNRLLYDAYVNRGLALLEGEQVELGLYYLDQAEKLGDLSQEVLDYRGWAELYLQGIAFYRVNWEVATYYFRELCLSAPFYQSACDRFYESLINYADLYAGALDWCPAQALYQEALQHGRSQALIEKINQAAEACLLATPTPKAPITGTLPLTGTGLLSDSPFSFLTPEP